MWIVIAVFAVFLLLCAFLTAPNLSRKAQLEPFMKTRLAHRGLHDADHAENSLSAFRRAVENGFGIELDVRLSKDGELVVFHDDRLKRVTGDDRLVRDLTAEELKAQSLAGTGEGVPTFREVLDLVDGKVPVLVEIKEDSGDRAVSDATVKMLSDYHGAFLIESFNPLSLGRIRKQMPNVLRGQLCSVYTCDADKKTPLYFALQCFFLNVVSRPDFIAYDRKHVKFLPFLIQKNLWRAPCFAWTVRSETEESVARENGFCNVIFEKYIPKT